ncbi:MAG: OmpA/MotB [Pseudomonadota bacterium]
MKDKPNEWVAVADLMSGVVAVIMLLFIVSVLQQAAYKAKTEEELKKYKELNQKSVRAILYIIQESFKEHNNSDLVQVDFTKNKLIITEGIFGKGSACLSQSAKDSFIKIGSDIKKFLSLNPKNSIYIEGHTDNLPVLNPIIDYKKFCTVYADNYSLSASRAIEIKKVLDINLSRELASRLIVAGYGDSHPIKGLNPSDPRNRRVEILFVEN